MAGERSLTDVPRAVWFALLGALIVQIAWQTAQPRPVASAVALTAPPPVAVLRVASIGEPVVLAQLTTLYLQAFDNQPGVSIPFQPPVLNEFSFPNVLFAGQTLRGTADSDKFGFGHIVLQG